MAKKTEHLDEAAPATLPTVELLTVAQLAEKHGQTSPRRTGFDTPYSRSHLGADAAHGWTRHAFFKSQEVRLSDEDYLAALAAFDSGKIHESADMRPKTVFTADELKAKFKADAKTAAAKPGAILQPGYVHAQAKKRASHVAHIGKTITKQKTGVR